MSGTSTLPDMKEPAAVDVYAEGKAKTYVPKASGSSEEGPKDVFINPIQCYNRDLSVVAIRAWSELLAADKKATREAKAQHKQQQRQKSKKRKLDQMEANTEAEPAADAASSAKAGDVDMLPQEPPKTHEPPPYHFTAFEALAASGLRSIRYAMEIPLLKSILTNDLSKQAVQNIKRNLVLNGYPEQPEGSSAEALIQTEGPQRVPKKPIEKITPNEGDCMSVMYQHREKFRFDMIDLDPYGTAAPFLDAAVQSVNDGGLLCVTCTDLAVLAGTNYPEKCYSNYGGVTARAEYCHEGALRLLLQTISTTAARYGRKITPLLSFSIDYYIRVFVKVHHSAQETKRAITENGLVYVCSYCQNFVPQPFGRLNEKPTKKGGVCTTFKPGAAAQQLGSHCAECGSSFHVAGPMWLGPLHDRTFVDKMLETVNDPDAPYHTLARLKGMLNVARQELDEPFYFTPARIAGNFHATVPALSQMVNALLHLGYEVSRSHAAAGSLKTNASRAVVHDIMMAWIDKHPVKLENIDEKNPARKLLAREREHKDIDFDGKHPKLAEVLMNDVKLVRYQMNPEANWGPQSRAVSGTGAGKQ